MFPTRFNVFWGPFIESVVLFPLLLNCLTRWDAFMDAQFNSGLVMKNLKTRTNTATRDVSSCHSECGGWTLVCLPLLCRSCQKVLPSKYPHVRMIGAEEDLMLLCQHWPTSSRQAVQSRLWWVHCFRSGTFEIKQPLPLYRFTSCPPHPSYYGNA